MLKLDYTTSIQANLVPVAGIGRAVSLNYNPHEREPFSSLLDIGNRNPGLFAQSSIVALASHLVVIFDLPNFRVSVSIADLPVTARTRTIQSAYVENATVDSSRMAVASCAGARQTGEGCFVEHDSEVGKGRRR
jgi:hypothetical protein